MSRSAATLLTLLLRNAFIVNAKLFQRPVARQRNQEFLAARKGNRELESVAGDADDFDFRCRVGSFRSYPSVFLSAAFSFFFEGIAGDAQGLGVDVWDSLPKRL
jgi:hypothetical protein